MRNRLDGSDGAFEADDSRRRESKPTDRSSAEPDPEPVLSDVARRFALTQMTTKRFSFLEDLEFIRQLGLRQIGLWRLKYEEYSEAETAELLEEFAIKPSSISWVGGFTGANGYLIKDSLVEAESVIQFASWIGARTVVVSTGEQGTHIHSHAMRIVAEALQHLGEFAAEHGVRLAVMPMSTYAAQGWTFLTSLRKTRQLLEQCGHPAVGFCLHSYHVMQQKHWKSELSGMITDLKLVRLCDGNFEARPRNQLLPYHGNLKLTSLIEFLEERGYCGEYEIDVWSDAVWMTDEIEPFQACLDHISAHFPSH